MSAVEGAARRSGDKAKQEADAGRGWYAVLARTGLVAKGASFALVGVLAIKLATGSGGKATSREGALHDLAGHSFGKVVLVALALGFAAYALWRFVQAFAERQDADDGAAKVWGKRAGYVGRGVIYAGLAFSTLKILAGSGGGQSQNEKAHKSTALVLDWPGGRLLVGAAGLVVIGVGAWNLYRGLARKFEDKWRVGRLSPTAKKWGGRAGVVGHAARFVVFGLIGVFLVKAAIDFSSKDAIGLDGALQKLAHASYGPILLGLTAVGLIAYGVYCVVDARLRDVATNR
jgi:Domain of Unknown Function (DUF1206)